MKINLSLPHNSAFFPQPAAHCTSGSWRRPRNENQASAHHPPSASSTLHRHVLSFLFFFSYLYLAPNTAGSRSGCGGGVHHSPPARPNEAVICLPNGTWAPSVSANISSLSKPPSHLPLARVCRWRQQAHCIGDVKSSSFASERPGSLESVH